MPGIDTPTIGIADGKAILAMKSPFGILEDAVVAFGKKNDSVIGKPPMTVLTFSQPEI